MAAKGIRVKTALISVYSKNGLVDFADSLKKMKIRIISTGNTSKVLTANGIKNDEVSSVTRFPEMLDGRVKTLHPMIHGGILARRDKKEHMQTLTRHKIPTIDLVVIDLYPFEEVLRTGASRQKIIEMIDIGGPTMLRAAAKNHSGVAAVCDIKDYGMIVKELNKNSGILSTGTVKKLAAKVFAVTASYDSMIAAFMDVSSPSGLPEKINLSYRKSAVMRYGENPHQAAAFYVPGGVSGSGFDSAKVHGGKELSYNNYLDLDAAWNIVCGFSQPAACVIKHNNPCGFSAHADIVKAFQLAHECDPLSAFGGIVGVNRKVSAALAKKIVNSGFLECVIAPSYEANAVEVLKTKKNLRIVEMPKAGKQGRSFQMKQINGALLLQEPDLRTIRKSELKCVTKKKPTAKQLTDLITSFELLKYVKSNAIVIMKNGQASGVGMGQPSRVDSVQDAIKRSGKRAKGAVLASDGFFPKPDSIQVAAKAGVAAIIQPGGSIQDETVIQAADKAGIAMLMTGHRHFTH